MKKIICIILALACITMLVSGCGKDDKPANVIVESESTPIETTVGNENIATEPTTDVTEQENNEPGKSAKYTGTYSIDGYSAVSFGSSRELSIGLNGVDNDYSWNFDATNTSIPNFIVDFDDYIYLHLVFDNDGLVSWSVINKETMDDVGQPSQNELEKILYPEMNYEQVPAGDTPEKIFLSQYAPGKTYVFNASKDPGEFVQPTIVNDTERNAYAISVRVGTSGEIKRTFSTNKILHSNSLGLFSTDNDNGKLYVSIIDTPIQEWDDFNNCVLLSPYQVGDMINFGFEDFVYNDTENVITISYKDEKYVLQPYEMIECNWIMDIIVEEINQ